MHPIIYDVAVSIDGYISGPGGDISGFAQGGPVVDDYLARLGSYATAIMGRATYEFGYRFGMEPGQNPYIHMKTYVFSSSLTLPDTGDVSVASMDGLTDIRAKSEGPIYLCGGGEFAGHLLSKGLIDRLRLKRAPIHLGGGVRLFGGRALAPKLTHIETHQYEDGYLFQDFAIRP